MDLNYSQEESAFRDEVRGWLKANLPQDLRDKIANYDELTRDDLLRWHKILAKKGWVAPAWPKEYGGGGARRVVMIRSRPSTRRASASAASPTRRVWSPSRNAVAKASITAAPTACVEARRVAAGIPSRRRCRGLNWRT